VSLDDAITQSGGRNRLGPLDLRAYLNSEIDCEYGAGAGQLSSWCGLDEGSDGGDLIVTGGYDTLAEHAGEGLDIELGWPVETITRTDTAVTVTGTTGSYTADRVVVTVPVGVLAQGAITFEPALPDNHQQAINKLATGLLDKVWFLFDEPVWDQDALMWTNVTDGDVAFTEWFNLQPVTGQPVLLTLLGGPSVTAWAGRTDKDVEQAAMARLDEFLTAGW
jgi:monoamine oxidase